MVKGVWIFEVPEERQAEYLRKTSEEIKPYWESHGCISYEVYQDYTNPCRFIKEQHYPNKKEMEKSFSLAGKDPKAKEVITLFGEFAENIVRMRCVPRIDKTKTRKE